MLTYARLRLCVRMRGIDRGLLAKQGITTLEGEVYKRSLKQLYVRT